MITSGLDTSKENTKAAQISSPSVYESGDTLILPLTGIRQVAAFMVVIHHLTPATPYSYLSALVRELNIGVTIFFVLSGFLIALRYFEEYKHNYIWSRKFLINRFARIYPMYFLVTALTLALFFFNTWNSAEHMKVVILNVTLLKGFSQKYAYSGIAQGWTLTVEQTFYFLAPLLFFSIRRLKLFPVLIITIIGGVAILYLAGLGTMNFLLSTTLFGRASEFFAGIALYFIYKRKLPAGKRITIISGILFLLLLTTMPFFQDTTHHYALQTPGGLFVNNVIFPVVIAAFFYGLIKENTWISKLLSTKLFQVLGKSSYTLYLIHYGAIIFLLDYFVTHSVLLMILIVQALAILLWRFVEEPLNHFVKASLIPVLKE